MKRYLLTLAAVLAAYMGLQAQDHNDHKSNKPRIEGSGNIVTKELPVQAFDKLDAKGVFDIRLAQGSKEEVKIEGDDNLLSLFTAKNEGSTLVLSMNKDANYNSKKKIVMYVSFKKLKSLNLKTVGSISSTQDLAFDDLTIDSKSVGMIDLELTAQKLTIQNKGVGAVHLKGKADNAVIRNDGVGQVDAANFVVQSMDIENNGVGSAEVNAQKEFKVKESFIGKVTNKGSAKKAKKIEI
jgi:hypothetical protein